MLSRYFARCSILEQHLSTTARCLHTSNVDFAKRRGFRIKKDRENKAKAKLKKAAPQPKQEWVPPNLRIDQSVLKLGSRRFSDQSKQLPPQDDVFFTQDYKELIYKFEDAIEAHREQLHPTILNEPNALVKARIELNLRLKKKTKFMAPFNTLYLLPNQYDFQRTRRVVAICPSEEIAEKSRQAGAMLAGGAEVIKMLQERTLKEIDFDFIICHTDMLIPLAEVRKVIGDHFPSKQLGNFGKDLPKLIDRFVNGIHYHCERDRYENDYGWVEQHFGKLNMPLEQLRENFVSFLNELQKQKPSDTEHPFITRVLVEASPSSEKFRIDFWNMMDNMRDPVVVEKELTEKEKEKEEKRKTQNKKRTIEEDELEKIVASIY